MKNKRGALVQATLISIIIIVISAAILFYFFRYLPYSEIIDKEACHQSVILRNNVLLRGDVSPIEIPLNCKTQEIIIKSANEEFVKREVANAMYDCWWMLGEGKLDFFSEGTWKTYTGMKNTRSSCIVCSVIRFDDVTRKLEKVDLIEYIETKKLPNKNTTYLKYFLDDHDAELPTELRIDMQELDLDKDYAIIYMGIKGDTIKDAFKDWGRMNAMVFGGTFAATGLRGTTGIVKLVAKHPIALVLIEAGFLTARLGFSGWNQHVAFQHCSGEREGCYVLMIVPLTAEKIGEQCQNIESIP